ncbi:MAG: disulfide bond formation protein B [Parcubacteria group bacterium]
MLNVLTSLLPHLTLASHIVLIFILLALVFDRKGQSKTVVWLGHNAIRLGLLISFMGISGSLLYSIGLGYEPCVLCWWQRVLLFPLPIIFLTAWWRGKGDVFQYVVPLVVIAFIIALYQSYTYMGGVSILECTSVEGDCSRVYVKEFGYITIPMMSLTISAYILALAWAKKIYDKNRHA